MGKTFSKDRKDREYHDDENVYEKMDNKKRKKQNAELRRMRNRQYSDESYEYDNFSKFSRTR